MPSRVIISSVNAKTPQNAAGPSFGEDAASLPSMSFFMCRPARHMCTVSEATRNAAAMPRIPSHSAWFRALDRSSPAPMLSSIEAPMPQ